MFSPVAVGVDAVAWVGLVVELPVLEVGHEVELPVEVGFIEVSSFCSGPSESVPKASQFMTGESPSVPADSAWPEPNWLWPEAREPTSPTEVGSADEPFRGNFVGFGGESWSGRRCPTPAFALSSLAVAPAPVMSDRCCNSCPTMLISVERPALVSSNLTSTSLASLACWLDNVVILDIDTKSNPADLFTKNLGREILRLIDWICGYEPIPPVPDFTTP